jgi:transposase InsO family protein
LAVFSSGVPVSVTELARDLGVSRQTVYKYRLRWAGEGAAGLVERSRRPRNVASVFCAEMEQLVVRLREELPVDNGAQTIRYHLERSELAASGARLPSVSSIHRFLAARGLVTPQPHKRPKTAVKRFVWPKPNDAWQIDATAWALSDGRQVWVMDVLDDHSRVLIAARVADGPTSKAAWDAFSHGVAAWGLPARVMSDNGICFTGRFWDQTVDFERQLASMGIKHIPSSPGHPQTCGKIERSHQTTKRWLALRAPADTPEQLQAQLDEWLAYYNAERPHRSLAGATPAQAWAATAAAKPGDPIPGPRRSAVRSVSTTGSVAWNNTVIGLDARRAGEQVLIVANGLRVTIYGQSVVLRQLTIDPTRRYQPTGNPPGRRKAA